MTSSSGSDLMRLCRATLDILSEKKDCSFLALCTSSLGVGIGVAAKALTAVTRSSLSGGMIAPGVGTVSSESDPRTWRLRLCPTPWLRHLCETFPRARS